MITPARDEPRIPPQSDVLATVLVYNNHSAALRTLLCVRRQRLRPAQVVVIDNGSAIPFKTVLEERGFRLEPTESVVRIEQNRGVGAGHNRAVEIAIHQRRQYIWLLEHDSFVDDCCLATMLPYITNSKDPSLVMVNPRLARNYYEASLDQALTERTDRRWVRPGRRGHTVTFNGLLMQSALARRLSPIREDLVVGLEDRELATRADALGAELVTTAEWLGVHPNNGLGRYPEPQSPLRCYYSVRNYFWLEREMNNNVSPREVLWAGLSVLRDLAAGDYELAQARARGLVSGVRGPNS